MYMYYFKKCVTLSQGHEVKHFGTQKNLVTRNTLIVKYESSIATHSRLKFIPADEPKTICP